MGLVIFVTDFERHCEIPQWVGGKQNRAAIVMDFIKAQDAGAVGANEIPMTFHVDLLMGSKESRMDIAQRHPQQIILLHAAHDRQVRHAVANQGIGHGVTDFQGTFRERLASLACRTRGLARTVTRLEAGMPVVVGAVYNFCTPHASLGAMMGKAMRERAPAMAAGIRRRC